MKKTIKRQCLNRMNYILGHLQAVKKMIENDLYCIDIFHQNNAVCEAIKKVNGIILKNHLDTCVTQAIKGRNEKERKKKLKELFGIYKRGYK